MTTPLLLKLLLAAQGLPDLVPREWETVLAQGRRSLLLARLADRLQQSGQLEAVPEGPRWHLQASLVMANRANVETAREVEHIRQALNDSKVRCVLLKGAAYLCADLPPSRGRLFGDIDILVPQSQLTQTEAGLFGAGWVAAGLDAYDQRYYRDWMHELPPLWHISRGSTIDVHHTITAPTSAFPVDGEQLLAAARPINDEATLWVLQPVDMVLHSAVHLFQEGEFSHGLRDLLDLDDLLRHFEQHEPGFWPDLFARAQALRLQRPLHHALTHVERVHGPRVPTAWRAALRELRPTWFSRYLMAWLLGIALRPRHPTAQVPGEGFALWLLYVRSHWLRMPPYLLVPHLLRKAWRRRFPAAGEPAA